MIKVKKRKFLLLPGDGIGPEVIGEVKKIIFGNKEISFDIDEFKKKCLMEGLDDIALSLEKIDDIVSFEKKMKSKKPWIFND